MKKYWKMEELLKITPQFCRFGLSIVVLSSLLAAKFMPVRDLVDVLAMLVLAMV